MGSLRLLLDRLKPVLGAVAERVIRFSVAPPPCGGATRSLVPSALMPRRMVLLALKFEELVYGGHRGGITRPDSHFPSPHPIDGRVADSCASRAHHRRSRHVLRVDLERLREITRPKRSRDIAHVRANRLDAGAVRRIHVEDHATAVGQILEDMC